MPLKGFIFGALSAVLVLVLSVLLIAIIGIDTTGYQASTHLAFLALLAIGEELCRGVMLYKLFERSPWSAFPTFSFAIGFFAVEAVLKYQQHVTSTLPAASPIVTVLALSLLAHICFTLSWYALSRKNPLTIWRFVFVLCFVSLGHFIWNTTILHTGL